MSKLSDFVGEVKAGRVMRDAGGIVDGALATWEVPLHPDDIESVAIEAMSRELIEPMPLAQAVDAIKELMHDKPS